MNYCLTFTRNNPNERVTEPVVQFCAEPGEADYGWQSYVVLPQEIAK
jgi:hypothetical protein